MKAPSLRSSYLEQSLDSSETYLATIGHPISVSSMLGSNQLATESLIFLAAYTNPSEDQLGDFAGE